ncbi:MAG: thiamine-phosphate kinase [Alphaproteobacteria bacterium]
MAANGIGDEFDLIAKYLAPLAAGAPGALGLTDDAAILDVPADQRLVAAVDTMVAGIHFLGDDPPGDIARKIIRVNLSDLAAMGARPLGLLLALVLPRDVTGDWMERFAAGLKADSEEFHAPLIGGDTVASDGPLTLSLTALGAVPAGQVLTRGGALAGDAIYVTGTIGDGALGLGIAKGALKGLDQAQENYLVERYRRPRPRLEFGVRLLGHAHAAIDVSDGLIADLGHICTCSGVGARLVAQAVPLSSAAQAALRLDQGKLADLLTGGDDYELLFTAPPENDAALRAIASDLAVDVTRIGSITDGGGLEVDDGDGLGLKLENGGYRHFRRG